MSEIEIYEVVDSELHCRPHICDFCCLPEYDTTDLDKNNLSDFREMYRLKDGCLLCEACLEAGAHLEEHQ